MGKAIDIKLVVSGVVAAVIAHYVVRMIKTVNGDS